MRAQAFNFLSFFGVTFTLFAPSVVASLTTDIDFKELASKPGLVLSGPPEPSHERRQTGVGTTCGPVTGANVTGTCFNANTTCCNGFYSVGFCPSPSNVRCCTIIHTAGEAMVSATMLTMYPALYHTSPAYARVRRTSVAAVETTVSLRSACP